MTQGLPASRVADIAPNQTGDRPAKAAPARKMYRRAFTTIKLTPDAVDRQSRITLLAWRSLGVEGAKSFLNTRCDALNGRPLDLAVSSALGFDAVTHEISKRAIAA